MNTDITVIGVHSGVGAGDVRTGGGAGYLEDLGFADWLGELGYSVIWRDVCGRVTPAAGARTHGLKPGARRRHVVEVAAQVSRVVEECVRSGRHFLVLGGDHSIAMGTWAGVRNAIEGEPGPGLVWFDAHLDSHTPLTTPSGNYHGMPLAHLLGHGIDELVHLCRHPPALAARSLSVVGVRSFEFQEPVLLDLEGVRRFSMDEIRQRGIRSVGRDVGDRLRGCPGFGISIDLDVLDPEVAPGVGSPVAGGLGTTELIDCLDVLLSSGKLLGVEFAEFNPQRDISGRTAAVIRHLIAAIYGSR